jgi:hypothetical protein
MSFQPMPCRDARVGGLRHWARLRLAIALGIVALSCTGCIVFAHLSINDQITHEKVEFIKKGQTTFQDILDELGAPTRLVGKEGGGAVAIYQFLDIRYSRVNYGWLTQFAPQAQGQSIDLILGGGGLGTDMFQIFFDDRWVATDYVFTKHAEKVSKYVFWPF